MSDRALIYSARRLAISHDGWRTGVPSRFITAALVFATTARMTSTRVVFWVYVLASLAVMLTYIAIGAAGR